MTHIKLSVPIELTPEAEEWLEAAEAAINAEQARMEQELACFGFCFAPDPGAQAAKDVWFEAMAARVRGELH
jgi:hypothetical protein